MNMVVQVAYCRECSPPTVIASVPIDPESPVVLNHDWMHVTEDGKKHTDVGYLEVDDDAEDFLAGKEDAEAFHKRLSVENKKKFV